MKHTNKTLIYRQRTAIPFFRGLLLLFGIMFFSGFNTWAQDPAQYGTPFNGVPDVRDINMYQVHPRPFSANGDLDGVTAKLDHIKAMGTNVIYLMPIYPVGQDSRSSPSPYCIKDFSAVGAEYGSLQDLRELVDGAHSRGMAVMLDVAINGTSWDNEWTVTHPEYYMSSGGQIQQLANFSDIAALNLNYQGTRDAIKAMLRYWVLAANVDGFRCDFANNPPLDFWSEVISDVNGINTHDLLWLAEGDRQENFQVGFDMNFGDRWFWNALKDISEGGPVYDRINAINDYEYALATGTQQAVRYTGNHDTYTNDNGSHRPFVVFHNHDGIVANFLVSALLKGVPFLMGGQEIDYEPRTDWPWTNFKFDWNQNPSAKDDFAKILNFRTSSTAVRRGNLTMFQSSTVSAFVKTSGSEKVVVMANLKNQSSSFVVTPEMAGSYKDAFTGADVTLTSGTTQNFNAYGYLVATNANVTPEEVTGVSVSPSSTVVGLSATQQLFATISPVNATNKDVTWSSNNTNVATVNGSGVVTGVSIGNATITVTTDDGGFTANSAISVESIAVSSVSVSPTSSSLFEGATQQLNATIAPSNANNQEVTWSSNNTSVATVNSSGLVTAVGAGSVAITVSSVDGNKTAVATINVAATTNFTVHFSKPTTWGTGIRIYNWDAQPAGILADGSWPGVSMNSEGGDWYSYTFTNVTSTNLIFNDGSNQTANLSRGSDGWYKDDVWYNSDPGPGATSYLTLSTASQSFAEGASGQNVTVSANVSWSVRDNQNWISTSSTSGSNNGNFTVNVTTNTGAARTGTVTVSGDGITRTVNISQEAVTVAGQAPFGGTARAIPGIIEVEDFDTGGQGVAYSDSDASNNGGQYRTSDGVDIENASEGGYNIGWTGAGEWLEYTVNVASAGLYDIDARVAATTNGSFNVEIAGQTATLSTASTGGWQNWQTVSVSEIDLSAGQYIMRIALNSGGFNLDKVIFSASEVGCTPSAITAYSQVNGGSWNQNVTSVTLDEGGSVNFGPQVVGSGSWSWTGPNGYSASVREISLSNLTPSQSGDYMVTFTNAAGCVSSLTFTMTVNTIGVGTSVYIKNRWQGTYLYDAGTDVSYSGFSSSADHQWELEDVDGHTAFKNIATGHYINIEALTGTAECTSISTGAWSAQWAIEDYDGHKRIRNRWQSGDYIHVENLSGSAQSGSVYAGAHSSHWLFESAAGARIRVEEDKIPPAQQVLLYPNPVQDVLHLKLSSIEGESTMIRILDTSGRTILSNNIVSNGTGVIDLDLSSLKRGIYVVVVNDLNEFKSFKITKS